MSNFNVILIGCGSISNAWLKPTHQHPQVTYVGLVDLNLDNAEAMKAKYNLSDAVVTDDLSSLLQTTDANLLFNCATPEVHASITIEALNAGLHVLGEKPLAMTLTEAKAMVAAAKTNKKVFAVMQNRRFLDGVIRLREAIASGLIGDLTTLNADFYIGAHFGGFRDEMNHVLLLDMAIHSFDQARFIGECDPLSVYCHEWNPDGSWYKHGASAMAIFEMNNGILFNYRGSWASEGLRTSWECQWRAIGTKGSIYWDGHDLFLGERVTNEEGFFRDVETIELPQPTPLEASGHDGLILDFLNCLNENRTPNTIASDNIHSLAMVLAAIESANSQQKKAIVI